MSSQTEWESKISSQNAALMAKHQQRVKHLETFVDEQSIKIKALEQQLRNSVFEREKLNNQLAEKHEKQDEGGPDNENFILRREMDNLLKEKIFLSSENSDLRRRLNVLNDNQYVYIPDDKSSSNLNKSQPNKEKSGIKEKESSNSKNVPEVDLELRSQVLSFFAKRYPKVTVTQINRSTHGVT